MITVLWIIAICEIIRMLQNALQLYMMRHETGARDNAYQAFIESMKDDERTMVRKMLKEIEKMDEVSK